MLICENSTRGTVASTRFSTLKTLIYTVFKNEKKMPRSTFVSIFLSKINAHLSTATWRSIAVNSLLLLLSLSLLFAMCRVVLPLSPLRNCPPSMVRTGATMHQQTPTHQQYQPNKQNTPKKL